jgi:hypothetical protein
MFVQVLVQVSLSIILAILFIFYAAAVAVQWL